MKPGQHRHPYPDSIPPGNAPVAGLGDVRLDEPPTAIFSVALATLREGFSVVPLVGGDDPMKGKRPAIKWKLYMRQKPTEDELHTWFIERAHTAYGIVCGPISRLIVLDLDDETTAQDFTEHFPHLMNTRVVRSGLRGTPHIYWRIDRDDEYLGVSARWSKSRKVIGGDLKGQGGYVVGPGSSIAGGQWEIINNTAIRSISPSELNEALRMLATPNSPNQTRSAAFSAASAGQPQQRTCGDFVAMYRSRIASTGQRNNALFEVTRSIRDEGYPQQWAVEELSDLHASELPRNEQCQENYKSRIAEACATIASVYSKPARRKAISDEQASRLPNALREHLLQRADGAAIIRTLEGLYLKGLRPGNTFTEKAACQILKGVVGRHSIIIYINFNISFYLWQETRFSKSSPPINPLFQANAEQNQEIKSQQKPCCLSPGQNQTKGRPAKEYIYPSIDALCTYLSVEPSGSDPLWLEDLKSPKTLRMALEREFIKRRPGQYFQDLLAARLGVSDRTIRRYHRDIPINSQPRYLETPVWGFNIDRIPTADTIKRYDLDLGGQFLEDDTGKRWPLKQEIARMLLAQKRYVVHKIQTASFYYFGDLPPPEAFCTSRTATGPPMEEQVRRILAENQDRYPVSLAETHTVAQREPATYPVKSEGIATDGKPRAQLPLLPGTEPRLVPSKPERPSRNRNKNRHYAKPLAEEYLEQLAKDTHEQVDRLSLSNARQLVDVYGLELVKRTLGKMKWLAREGKLRNPAGFMITAIRVAWKEEDKWGGEQSSFKSILPHKPNSKDNILIQSEAYRKWRANFGWDGDYFTLLPAEEELPY